MQDAQDHHVIVRNAIVHGVWKATGEGPPNISVDYQVQCRGAVDTVEHLLYAQQERSSKSLPLPLIPSRAMTKSASASGRMIMACLPRASAGGF